MNPRGREAEDGDKTAKCGCPSDHAAPAGGVSPGDPGDKGARYFKVKLAYKLANFTCAVVSLSWFFEGWRQVGHGPGVNLGGVAWLVAGTVGTLVFLFIHGMWVYMEEKSKGTLKRSLPVFDRFYAALTAKRQDGEVVACGKGES